VQLSYADKHVVQRKVVSRKSSTLTHDEQQEEDGKNYANNGRQTALKKTTAHQVNAIIIIMIVYRH